jgi:hypothetical protein
MMKSWNSKQSHDSGTRKVGASQLSLTPLARNIGALPPPTTRRAEKSRRCYDITDAI